MEQRLPQRLTVVDLMLALAKPAPVIVRLEPPPCPPVTTEPPDVMERRTVTVTEDAILASPTKGKFASTRCVPAGVLPRVQLKPDAVHEDESTTHVTPPMVTSAAAAPKFVPTRVRTAPGVAVREETEMSVGVVAVAYVYEAAKVTAEVSASPVESTLVTLTSAT